MKRSLFTPTVKALLVLLLSMFGMLNVSAQEAYGVWDSQTATFTHYYDNLKSTRTGIVEDGEEYDTGDVDRYSFDTNDVVKVVYDQSVANCPIGLVGGQWCSYMPNLTTIEGLEYLNTGNDRSFADFFFGCSSLKSLDLSTFDTRNATNMINMFYGCTNLKTIYVGENWSVAGVTNSTDMFKNCSKLVGGAGTACNGTSNIDKTYARIDGGTDSPGYLTDISQLSMYAVYGSGKLTFYYDGRKNSHTEGTTFDLNTGMNVPSWLNYNSSITTVEFDSSFADARPTSTYYWFFSMSRLSDIIGLEYLNTSEVTYMNYMFHGCSQFESLDLRTLNTSKVTNMYALFDECTGLKNVDVSSWNTANVKTMKQLFNKCSSLSSVDLSNFNTINVTDMSYMFRGTNLTSLNLASFDTHKLANTSYMFKDCSNLKTIYVGENWSVAGVTSFTNMFEGCTSLVGGAGTACDGENNIDKEYARVDVPDNGNAGYLTAAPYTLYTSNAQSVLLTFDSEENVFKGDLTIEKGCNFYFEDLSGNIFIAEGSNIVVVNASHNTDLPVAEQGGGYNFEMDASGTFTFKLKITAEGKTLTVVPTSGVWPPVTPSFFLCHNYNGETVYIPFSETESGKYELNYTFPYSNWGFWFFRRLEGVGEDYANDSNNGGNLKLNPYNSKGLSLYSTNRSDFVFSGKGPATFHITDLNDGNAPKLTITDWPQSRIDLVYDDSQVGQLTYDEATDTYSIEYTVEKNKDIWFIDVTYGRPLMVNSDEDLTLNRKTSSNIVLSAYPTCSSGGRFLQMKQGGTFTFKVKLTDEGALVDVVWPDPIFRPNIPNAPDFVKQPDGSYTTEVTLNFEQVGNDGCQFDIIDASMAELDYYGIPNVMLTRKNSQNLELGQGDDFYNIHLYKVGTYTLTISPDFKLSIGWPEADYYLYVRDNNYKTTFVPFNYDAETETYFIENYPLEEGFGVWICDDATGQGYGIPGDDNYPPLTREFAANGFVLYPSGWIPIIQATGNFTFAMKEQENGNGLDVTMTGWPMPYYIYDIYKEENVGTFVENGDGTCSCTLEVTDDMIDTNYFRFAIADDDEKYYYSGNSSNIIVSGNNQTFQLMALVPGVSVYPIHIKPGQYILTFNPATLTLTVKKSIHGDVNGDGNVTFADVTALVNIILGKPACLSDNYVNYQVTKNPSYINYESHSFNLGGKALKAIEFALGLSPTELAEKMVQNNTNPLANGEARFMPVDANGNLVCTSSTANNYGYWFNDDGEVDSWGPTAKVGVEMSIPDGNITLVTFQHPEHNQSGDKISITTALVYKNDEGKQGTVWFTFDFVFNNENAVTLKSVSIPVLDTADMNGDTNVTIADVTKLVNILWGKE